jgi:hypothetical protein
MKTTKLNFVNLKYSKIVKNIKNLAGASLLLALALTSCKDPEEVEPQADGAALTERFENNRDNATQHFTVDIDGGAMVEGSQGTRVIFPANSIGLNGNPVTGDIEVDLIEIYNKSAMVLQNMPTSGIKPNADQEALKSAGEFFLNATQNGNQLEILLPVQIESRGIDPADWEPMQVFRAGDNADDTDLWVEADENDDGEADVAGGREGEGPNGVFVLYSVFDTSSFGWTNLDRWYNYAGQLTDIFVDTPDDFTGTNCEVFLSYDGEPTALARMDIYDTSLEMFTEHYGRIPVGQQVHIIMVAEIGGQLHYTIQGSTVVDNHIEVMAAPQPTTQAALEAMINALP